jgi:hypothetical protein
MKERFDYAALQGLKFAINAKDRVIGTQNPAIYVKWEGASKEAVHGFVLHWEGREIHFVADCRAEALGNEATPKEEKIDWTITNVGTRSWKSGLRPYHFQDAEERRLACELAAQALVAFPAMYEPSTVTHVSARLSEGMERLLYRGMH